MLTSGEMIVSMAFALSKRSSKIQTGKGNRNHNIGDTNTDGERKTA